LRRRPLALHWQKPRRKAKCCRKASYSKRFEHWFPPFLVIAFLLVKFRESVTAYI
jgi:hypothetical protein